VIDDLTASWVERHRGDLGLARNRPQDASGRVVDRPDPCMIALSAESRDHVIARSGFKLPSI
jgi:hypothetical protein